MTSILDSDLALKVCLYALKSELASTIVFSSDDMANTSYSAVPGPLDVARSVIDRDIARLEESIRALKSRRNELSPISHLPPEILCTIFSFISQDNNNPRSWINFSRVSRHWRLLALNAPDLWTNIPLYNSRWAQEMLTRSKMAKLTIQADFTYRSSKLKVLETIKSCLSHMGRLGEINIFGASGSVLESIFQNIPTSAPQLHTLLIRSTQPNYSSDKAFTIHQDFLCDTERLKCVDLANCRISWDSQLLTGLTRLTLLHSLKDKANSSIIPFLHALQRMPALTNLDLEDSIPHDSGVLSTYPAVDLPCLRVLRISAGVGALTTALRQITCPSTAVLKLTCKEASTQIDFSNFLSVLATKFLSSLVIRNLSLHTIDTGIQNSLKFLLWTSAVIQGSLPSSLSAQLELVLTWLPSSFDKLSNYAKALTSAFDAMSLSALTQLQLVPTAECIDSKTWLKTFGKLPRLERVHVKSFRARSFFDALVYKTKVADKSKNSYCNVSFPKLRYIHLDGTHFVETNVETRSMSMVSLDLLMDRLMERYERNAEIYELHLDDCYNISEEDVEKLEEIVVDVFWDGVEQGLSSEYDSEEEREYDSDGNTIDDLDYDDLIDYDDYSFSYGRSTHWPF